MDASKLTDGQRAYEAKRAAKAGLRLEKWLAQKEKRAREDAAAAAAARTPEAAPEKKPGFFARLLERAQKPFG